MQDVRFYRRQLGGRIVNRAKLTISHPAARISKADEASLFAQLLLWQFQAAIAFKLLAENLVDAVPRARVFAHKAAKAAVELFLDFRVLGRNQFDLNLAERREVGFAL